MRLCDIINRAFVDYVGGDIYLVKSALAAIVTQSTVNLSYSLMPCAATRPSASPSSGGAAGRRVSR